MYAFAVSDDQDKEQRGAEGEVKEESADASIAGPGVVAREKEEGVKVAKWRAYMESYVFVHPTELVGENVRGRMRRVFLNR